MSQKKETAIEVKVGALVLVALAVFAGFIFAISDMSFGGNNKRLYVDYVDAAGLKTGAPVKLSGIRVGQIESVQFMGGVMDPNLGRPVYVRVTTNIEGQYLDQIREDANFHIQTAGLLGEPYIEVFSPVSTAPLLEPGDIVRGIDPPSLARVMQTVADTLDGVKILIDRLNEIEGSGTPIQIDEFINNIGSLAGSLDERIKANAEEIDSIFEDVAGILDENRDTLKRTLSNAEGLTAEFEQLGATLNHGLGRGQELRSIVRNLDTTMAAVGREADPLMTSARSAVEQVDGILAENRDDIRTTLNNLASITDDVDGVTGRIAAGEGTLGKLLADEEIFEDAREMIRELKRRPWRLLWKE